MNRYKTTLAALILSIVFSSILQINVLAQERDGIYLPLVANGVDTSDTSPSTPFQTATSTDLNDLGIALQNVSGEQFLIIGGQGEHAGVELYTYAEDDEETSSSGCDIACMDGWQPFTIDAAGNVPVQADIVAHLDTIPREDGTLQVTYHGWPLYHRSMNGNHLPAPTVMPDLGTEPTQAEDAFWSRATQNTLIEDESAETVVEGLRFGTSSRIMGSFAESGYVEIGQPSRLLWHTIQLHQQYTNPVVIVQPLSYQGKQPATIRVRNVTSNSFQFKMDEWSYLNGMHGRETAHYMVVEAGVHILDSSSGQKLQAGLIDVDHKWSYAPFAQPFTDTPIILSQVQSVNDADPVVVRQQNSNRAFVQLRLQNEEASIQDHAVETVGYIAMVPGEMSLNGLRIQAKRTANAVTHRPKWLSFGDNYESPIFLAAMQTFDGPDTATLRYKELTNSGVQLFVEEEQSRDNERNHTTEAVGYIVIGTNGVAPTPTSTPVDMPTNTPTDMPTDMPTVVSTDTPTSIPTEISIAVPTSTPTVLATKMLAEMPTDEPTDTPMAVPTNISESMPTDVPTAIPTDTEIVAVSTVVPTTIPVDTPTAAPTNPPVAVPTNTPTTASASVPTNTPLAVPTGRPTDMPTAILTDAPTAVAPTDAATSIPVDTPTAVPTDVPTSIPADTPTAVPTDVPTSLPTSVPIDTPTDSPFDLATAVPAETPTEAPMGVPTSVPTAVPTNTATATSTPTATPITQFVFVSQPTIEREALEKTAARTSVEIERQGGTGAMSVAFSTFGNSNPTKGSATAPDYIMRNASGQVLNGAIPFQSGQMTQTLTIEAVADGITEVPETLGIRLQPGADYYVRDIDDEFTVMLRDDAPGVTDESRFFFGQMGPENGAITTATGWAVIRLSNDNDFGLASLSFSGLTSVETASHIHYANPVSGPVIHSLPLGQVTDNNWDVRAAHAATTDQAMLNALLSGNLYINVHSKNYLSGEIRGTMRLTEGSPTFSPPPTADAIDPLADDELKRDIVRFLTQASFGPTEESVADMETRVAQHGGDRMSAFEAWIDEQIALESPSMLEFMHANLQSFVAPNNGLVTQQSRRAQFHYYPGWYTSAIHGKAQLRERTAFALSEILVISLADNTIRNLGWFPASYDDMLSDGAFGSYETLLTGVSKHPAMGHYLSSFRNQKEQLDANGEIVSSPDENYAREVMQLFSIGLVERHLDGSLKLGSDGLPVRTYEQEDITALSRIFTGLAFSVQMADGGLTNSTIPNTNFNYSGKATDYTQKQYYKPHLTMPMRMFNYRHDLEQKEWLGHTFPAGVRGEQEIDRVMDILSGDPNTAVLVSRQLIQRFVTSNPSSGYLYRVSKTFDDTNGNLGEVVKAILLDPEARNLDQTSNVGRGKIKEPLLQMVAMLRLLEPALDSTDTFNFARLSQHGYPASEISLFEDDADIIYLNKCLGGCNQTFEQAPLTAPTVFNYFTPDFAPPGPIIDAGFVSPELQLLDENNVIGIYNSAQRLIFWRIIGVKPEHNGASMKTSFVQPNWMVDAYMNVMDTNGDGEISATDSGFTDDATIRTASATLVDLVDDYLCAGRLQANATGNPQTDAREIIITGVNDALAYRDKRGATQSLMARDSRIQEALYLVTTAPQCTYME